MGLVRSFEPSITTTIYQPTWCNIPEDSDILSTAVRTSNLAASFLFGSAFHKISHTSEDGNLEGNFLTI